MSNQTRWIIEGTLELITPLHIGTGLDEKERDENKETRWLEAVALDHKGQPYIPGASLKGALRALAKRHDFRNLFDNKEVDGDFVRQAEFLSAWCVPDTDKGRLIQPRVAIDRVTGTAQDKKLFQTRLITPGTRFAMKIVVQNAVENEIADLLGLLNLLPDDPQFSLGAYANQGQGRVQWFGKIQTRCFGINEAKAWYEEIRKDESKCWTAFAKPKNVSTPPTPAKEAQLTLPLNLAFHTPFLVKQAGIKADDADAVPRRTHDDKIVLPASSLRGRLRTQSERILRTLGCETPQGHTAPAYRKGQPHDDLAVLLFGAAGWRGIVQTSDCIVEDKSIKTRRHEMLAIDRFTGGGKDGAKFNVDYVECPTLAGKLSLDLARLKNAKLKGGKDALLPALGLMTLMLRDLAEGDIPFGYGISKGYGQCRASSALGDWAELLKQHLGADSADTTVQALREYLGNPKGQELKLDPPSADATQAGVPAQQNAAKTQAQGAQEKFHNPYHFIPLSKPDISQWPEPQKLTEKGHSHDRYASLSGRIVCRLTTQTPLFIGSEQTTPTNPQAPKSLHPFKLNNGLAIPATSLRGMISSLFESVSNSNFRVLDEKTYSMRKTMQQSLSAMGRIVRHDQKLYLLPLTLPTLPQGPHGVYDLGEKWSAVFDWQPPPLRIYFDPPPRRTYQSQQPCYMKLSTVKYSESNPNQIIAGENLGALRFPRGNQNTQFLIGQSNQDECPITQAEYAQKSEDERNEYTSGWVRTLVKPGRDLPRSVKHHVFLPDVFIDAPPPVNDLYPIPDSVIQRFHDLADQVLASMNLKPEEIVDSTNLLPYTPVGRRSDSDCRDTRLQAGDLIFFDIDPPLHPGEKSQITEISFSSIWRSGIGKDHLLTTPDLLTNFDVNLQPHGMPGRTQSLSPAELLFGLVGTQNDQATTAYAGKVRIGFGLPEEGHNPRLDARITLKELSSPKPPSPALYFRKKSGKDEYVSKANLADKPEDYILRGRKMYLHAWRKNEQVVELSDTGHDGGVRPPWVSKFDESADEGNKRRVSIEPIAKDESFYFEVDFHNLSRTELAQLCATLYPNEKFEHRLGMGKPLGLGSIKITPLSLFLVNRSQRYATDGLDKPRYHAVWHTGTASEPRWPDHLQREQQGIAFEGVSTAPTVMSLAAEAKVSDDVKRALELLGNPDEITVPVHYPQLHNGLMESKQFDWFVQNDKSGRDQPANNRQHLSSFTKDTEKLEPLIRIMRR